MIKDYQEMTLLFLLELKASENTENLGSVIQRIGWSIRMLFYYILIFPITTWSWPHEESSVTPCLLTDWSD